MKKLCTMSDQSSIVTIALSMVVATEMCSKTEYAEEPVERLSELLTEELLTEELLKKEITSVELSTVFGQNPRLLTSHKDQSWRLVVRKSERLVLVRVLLYRLLMQQSTPVRYLLSADLQKRGQVPELKEHLFHTSPAN